MHCFHCLWNEIQGFFKVIQTANNTNEIILVQVKNGRCDLRIQSVSWSSREGAEPHKELKSDPGTLSGTEAPTWTVICECLCVFAFSSLSSGRLSLHLHAHGRRCLLHRAQVCVSLRSSHAQSLDTSLNSNSTFPGKFHINIAFLIPSKHYQRPEYTDIFWK